jgi:hypothetical protein
MDGPAFAAKQRYDIAYGLIKLLLTTFSIRFNAQLS